MTDGLTFDLGIGTKAARAEFKSFVADAQKALDSLSFNPREKPNSSRNNGIDHSRDVVAEQAHADRIQQIRADAMMRIDQIESTYGSQQLVRRNQLEQNINSITSQSSNRRIGDVQREVNANVKQFERQARAQQNAQSSSPSVNGKGIAAVFQVQQLVEDASFAGFRGAGNNAAMLASQLGGPAGLIALLGITGVQAVSMADSMNKASEDTDQLRLATERYKSELMALTEVKYAGDNGIVKTIEDVERLSRAANRAAGEKRALLETGNTRQEMASLLERFKQERSVVKSGDDFGGGAGPQAIQQALQRIEMLRERLKSIEPNFDWDRMLNANSFEHIDKIIKSVHDGTADWIAALVRSGDATKAAFDEWVRGAERLKKLHEFEAEHGLRAGEAFKAYTTAESSAEKVMIRKLEADVKYWENLANDAKHRLDKPAFEDASSKADKAANDAQKLRDVVDAIKKAEQEQLDTARDKLREQKEINREKERELSTHEQLLKSIEKEARAQRLDNATGDIDTRQGMANNMLDKMKERDQKIIDMSPNQDWQKMMTHQMNQYYDAMQLRQDRYFAREKEQQLKAKADGAALSDPKEQRGYLEDLQKHQQQQAMNAKTPQEANYWYQKSLQTQKMIEESFKQQQEAEKQKIEKIKEQIKSVEDLEKRVEDLSDELRGVPQLDMGNQLVIDQLGTIKKELRDIIELQQQMGKGGGAGGGMGGGGMPMMGGGGGGNPFAGLGDMFADGWGGGVMSGDAGKPFAGVDWNSPEFGGADGNPIAGSSPPGGWGFGAMNSGINLPQSFQSQSMQGSHSALPQAAFGGGMGTSFTTNNSVGNMPISINAAGFDMNKIAESARRQANNALLRRGA